MIALVMIPSHLLLVDKDAAKMPSSSTNNESKTLQGEYDMSILDQSQHVTLIAEVPAIYYISNDDVCGFHPAPYTTLMATPQLHNRARQHLRSCTTRIRHVSLTDLQSLY